MTSALPIADVLAEHMRLTAEHRELARQVAELIAAGKIAEATRLMEKTEAVYAELQKLEQASKPKGP